MDINEEHLHHPENDPAYMGLKVNQGVSAQPMINPNLRRIARRTYSVDEFVDGILRSDITCLSQAVTLVPTTKPLLSKSSSVASPMQVSRCVSALRASQEQGKAPRLTPSGCIS